MFVAHTHTQQCSEQQCVLREVQAVLRSPCFMSMCGAGSPDAEPALEASQLSWVLPELPSLLWVHTLCAAPCIAEACFCSLTSSVAGLLSASSPHQPRVPQCPHRRAQPLFLIRPADRWTPACN